ncbi:MAG: MaoC family dehydratase [Gemmataceae bacterium]
MYSDEHLYYEDFEVGDEWETAGRAITQADIRAFAELTGDFNPIHLNPEYAATTPFGRTIAHGLLTLSRASGMTVGHPKIRTLAVVELKAIKFAAPVYPDDVIHVRTRVLDKERRGRGKRGLVTWKREVLNQDGKLVQEGINVTLVEARDFPPPK